MSDATPTSDEQLVELVERIIQIDFDTEDAHTAAILELESMVVDPLVSEYIYHWGRHFEEEPSAADIVRRALAYRPISLGGATPLDQPDPVIRG